MKVESPNNIVAIGHSPMMHWYTYPLNAGHAVTTSWISHVLPNFIMLPDAFTNTSLGSGKSKDGDKAKTIPKIFLKV